MEARRDARHIRPSRPIATASAAVAQSVAAAAAVATTISASAASAATITTAANKAVTVAAATSAASSLASAARAAATYPTSASASTAIASAARSAAAHDARSVAPAPVAATTEHAAAIAASTCAAASVATTEHAAAAPYAAAPLRVDRRRMRHVHGDAVLGRGSGDRRRPLLHRGWRVRRIDLHRWQRHNAGDCDSCVGIMVRCFILRGDARMPCAGHAAVQCAGSGIVLRQCVRLRRLHGLDW